MKTKSTTPEARELRMRRLARRNGLLLRMRRLARRNGLLLKKPRKRIEGVEYFLYEKNGRAIVAFSGLDDLELLPDYLAGWAAGIQYVEDNQLKGV